MCTADFFLGQYGNTINVSFQDLVNSREASDELMSSKKFQKLLELILMVGNYLNTGSRNAQSLGFDLNYLTKVSTCFQIYYAQ